MVRKTPFKIDPPTKTVTIPGVSSAIADQFNRLMSERRRYTNISKAQIFEEIVLNERRKDVGDHMVQITMEIYNEKQEKLKQVNELIKSKQSNKSIEDGPE